MPSGHVPGHGPALMAIATATLSIADAVGALARGGVVAYPTEAVWGLGCDPLDQAAVSRLLRIKQRPVDKGLILVASRLAQLDGLVDFDTLPSPRLQAVQQSWPGPHTWVVPRGKRAPRWISGEHPGIAVRISAHPVVVALCDAWGGPLVSTSANLSGQLPATRLDQLDPRLLQLIDGLVGGDTGGAARPSTIADALSGEALRS